MAKVMRWIRALRRRWVKRQGEVAVEKALLDHELAERQNTDPRTAIPGMREDPFW
jgi:hypothetical protein